MWGHTRVCGKWKERSDGKVVTYTEVVYQLQRNITFNESQRLSPATVAAVNELDTSYIATVIYLYSI